MIRTIEVRNFKAIERGKVKLTPLTAFIGYNGMGKSSMLEGLQMFKSIIEEGLDAAIRPWREFEHIYYKGEKTKRYFLKDGIKQLFAPMEFLFDVNLETTNPLNPSKFSTSIGQENTSAGNIYFIEEKVSYKQFERSDQRCAAFVQCPAACSITRQRGALQVGTVHVENSTVPARGATP